MKPIFKALGVTGLMLVLLKVIRSFNIDDQLIAFQLLVLLSLVISTILVAFYATSRMTMFFNRRSEKGKYQST